jgi:hypothetical protein
VSDERADLMLRMLRAISAKQDEHDHKFDEVITRLGALERDFDESGMTPASERQRRYRDRRRRGVRIYPVEFSDVDLAAARGLRAAGAAEDSGRGPEGKRARG